MSATAASSRRVQALLIRGKLQAQETFTIALVVEYHHLCHPMRGDYLTKQSVPVRVAEMKMELEATNGRAHKRCEECS